MKKRPKPWVYFEMLLIMAGLLLAIYNGQHWGSPAVLFSIFVGVFSFRTLERYVFKQKTEFWFNLFMSLLFLVLAIFG
ncbi:hypothetical protein ACFQPF_15940 [Fictibacillus iocasae]|uniref:DUF4181 domain-containing protein n=1 Tax=Fictibacillus iocasae TaxID=2715437 RepID=A0ABW2NUV9_9BACL